MVRAIEGIYRDGKVELAEAPSDIKASRVYVLFVGENASDELDRKSAIEAVISDMERGMSLGGSPYPKREELYERDHSGQ